MQLCFVCFIFHCREFSLLRLQDWGYYTLSAHTFSRGVLSGTKQRGIPPTYAVPAALLGRLAVCRERKGVGLGGQLLVDALRRTVDLAEIVGVYALAVEAKYASAVAFYKHYEFIPFRDDPEKLFLPIRTIRAAVTDCLP